MSKCPIVLVWSHAASIMLATAVSRRLRFPIASLRRSRVRAFTSAAVRGIGGVAEMEKLSRIKSCVFCPRPRLQNAVSTGARHALSPTGSPAIPLDWPGARDIQGLPCGLERTTLMHSAARKQMGWSRARARRDLCDRGRSQRSGVSPALREILTGHTPAIAHVNTSAKSEGPVL